jgi:anaphase-promoting complex subunit 5
MSRYLTPSKIALLALIRLYLDGTVPSSGIIPILSFLTAQLIPQSTAQDDRQAPLSIKSLSLSISDFETVTKPFEVARGMPGRFLYDALLDRLWSIDHLHALHAFFRELSAMLVDPHSTKNVAEEAEEKPLMLLSRVSPLGIFVRRAQLEFTRLQFDDTVKLWVSYVQFRTPSEAAWRKRNPGARTNAFGSTLGMWDIGGNQSLEAIMYPSLRDGDSDGMELSTEDMERLFDFQLERLQSGS